MADAVTYDVVFRLLCRKAQRVAEDMRQLTIKMKALQGQLEKVVIYAENILQNILAH